MSRVLVVDDDIAEISAVKRVLARAGHDAVLATNSADAMIALDQHRPDLLVVSAECEGGEALTLARALRDNAATGNIPLMIVGDADPLPKGARPIARPIDPEVLAAEVEVALGTQGGISIELEEPGPAPNPEPARARKPAAKAAPPRPGAPAAEPPKSGAARPATTPPRPGVVKPPGAKAPAPSGPPHAAVAIGRLQSSSAAHASAGSGAGLSDAAASRRAAADALRARAEELRRSTKRTAASEAPETRAAPPGQAPAAKPAPPRAAPVKPASSRSAAATPSATASSGADPAGDSVPRPSPMLIAPIAAGSPGASASESFDLGDLDATLRKAEAAEEGARKEATPAPRPAEDEAREVAAPEAGHPSAQEARHRDADEALRELEEETAGRAANRNRAAAAERGDTPTTSSSPERAGAPENRDAAEERALQDAIQTARREAFEAAKRELQEQARKEVAEAARLIQAEARGRQEAIAAAEREARDLAHREAEARERAAAAGREIESLRSQLDEERRKGEERVATVMQRAAEEEEAAEETSRSHAVEEQKLREAISSARSEMDSLRRRHQEEARRRQEVEYALRRMAVTRGEHGGSPEEPAGEADPEFTPPAFFAAFDGAEPAPDPGEEAARRRVAALRGDAEAQGEDAPGGDGIPTGEVDGSFAPEEPARILAQPPPQLRAGDLAELPAPRLLAMALRARLEGRLDFRGETARSLWFEDGRVVGASSADPSERVEEVALRLGLVTRDQHRQIAQAAATLPTRRAAMLLLERGFLKTTELTALVRRRTEEVVFGVFSDAEARFRWMGDEVPPEERTALERGTLALAVEGVRRRWLAPRLDALLGGPATLLAPVAGAPAAVELGLSADERRVVGVADGLRALEEIVQASPLDALSTRQVLAALVLVGALTIRSLQAGRPPGHAVAAIDLARVREKLEQVRRSDYFTVLGVGRLCTPHEVRDAAQRLATEFDPRRFPQDDEGLPGRLAEILQVVHDAREVLADDRLRDEYLRGLGDGG